MLLQLILHSLVSTVMLYEPQQQSQLPTLRQSLMGIVYRHVTRRNSMFHRSNQTVRSMYPCFGASGMNLAPKAPKTPSLRKVRTKFLRQSGRKMGGGWQHLWESSVGEWLPQA